MTGSTEDVLMEEPIRVTMSSSPPPTPRPRGVPQRHNAPVPNPLPEGFDLKFTENVIAAMGPKTNPRMREVMTVLIQHLHAVVRETGLTIGEWEAATELLNEAGRISTPARNETGLICDILGIESLIDESSFLQLVRSQDSSSSTQVLSNATSSAILGPFWRADAPIFPKYGSIVRGLPASCPPASHTLMSGRVLSARTGKPLPHAELDVWQAAPNGLYEQQDPDQTDMNLRGRFCTTADGTYAFYCLRPTSYPIPFDGPSGRLLKLLDRPAMRPAHIHFIVSAPGHKPLTTQLYDRTDKYLAEDAVFGVKNSLILDFRPYGHNSKAQFEVKYDFRLLEA